MPNLMQNTERGNHMKNTAEQKYEAVIAGETREYTGHATKAAARRSINESLNPCLVEIKTSGRKLYDAFPLGHPLPKGAVVIERCAFGKWRTV
jgi:hypothetical protein